MTCYHFLFEMSEFVTFKWIAVAYDLMLKEWGYSDGKSVK